MSTPLILLFAVLASAQTASQSGTTKLQEQAPTAAVDLGQVNALNLSADAAASLQNSLERKNYRAAEALLLARIQSAQEPSSKRALLVFVGGVYFLAHDPVQAAVAWQKATALGALPERIRFSLAMAYIQMRRGDWAKVELTALHQAQPTNPLYCFWLGRLAYDLQKYSEAASWFRAAITAKPDFSRAHDNLGLCLFDMNDVDGSMVEYRRAIELQQGKPDASAWPYLNIGIAEEFRGRAEPAEKAFQQALSLDPKFAQAHYHLGNLYASVDRLQDAILELETASALDPTYAEPHAALARVYRHSGDSERSERQVNLYRELQKKKIGAE